MSRLPATLLSQLDPLLVLGHALAEPDRAPGRTRADLLARQDREVRRHLAWVRAHSPYYRDLFAGLDPRDWRRWPTTDKAAMMAHFDRLNTAGARLAELREIAARAERERDFRPEWRGHAVGLSSGTSGAQGLFLVSPAERRRWAGVVLRRLLGPDLARPQRVAFFLRADNRLYGGVASRRVRFEFFDLLRPLEDAFVRLHALAPTVLVGPPGALRVLAERGPDLAPRLTVSVAEVLEEQDAALLRARFGRVVQVYQATEGLLGLPCRHGTLHLNERHVAFDFEPFDSEDGGGGRLSPIVTDFRRRAQPIVRYRLNDLLVPAAEPCPCGSPALAIARVEGRADDVLDLPGHVGRARVFPDFVRRALTLDPDLAEYRVRQTGPDTLEVALRPDSGERRRAATEHLRAELARVGVDADALHLAFAPYVFTPGPRKLRRVERVWRPA